MADIKASDVAKLRSMTNAGMMDCKKALTEANGDLDAAVEIIRKKDANIAVKKAGREANEGVVAQHIQSGGKVGVLVEINCETDFVARTEEFEALGRNLAMQVAAMSPLHVDRESVPEGEEVADEQLLSEQEYIRDSSMKIAELVKETIGKLGENIRIRRFSRFELGG